jgi:hypothetical protein
MVGVKTGDWARAAAGNTKKTMKARIKDFISDPFLRAL